MGQLCHILPFLLLGVILDISWRRGIPTSCALNSKTENGVFLHEHAIRFFHPLRQNAWAPIIHGTMTTKATFMDILDLSMEIIYFFKTNNAKAWRYAERKFEGLKSRSQLIKCNCFIIWQQCQSIHCLNSWIINQCALLKISRPIATFRDN